MSQEPLSISSTYLLGVELKIALDAERKGKYDYFCLICNRRHSGVFYCEFCLANELYSRRKTMQFMKLDLCVQAAVCLIAKNAQHEARPAGAKQERQPAFSPAHGATYGKSEITGAWIDEGNFYSEFFGGDNEQK